MHSNVTCPSCASPNQSSNQFCAQCGLRFPSPQAKAGSTALRRAVLIVSALAVVWLALVIALGIRQQRQFDALVAQPRPTPSPAATPTPAAPAPTPVWKPSERLAKAKDMFDSGDSAQSQSDLRIIVEHLISIPESAPEYKPARALLPRVQAKLNKLVAEETTLGPKPENSGWNGKVLCVDRYLKETLNDYDSSEYLEWSPAVRMDVKGEPFWAVRLKLRAKNAFGAYIVKDVVFLIRQNTVVSSVGL